MRAIINATMLTALFAVPLHASWAQTPSLNPGNGGGDHDPVGIPVYPPDLPPNPALTTGSRYSVLPNTPPEQNPTVPGATGMTIVRGDHSTISGDRRETVRQKTGSYAADAPGG